MRLITLQLKRWALPLLGMALLIMLSIQSVSAIDFEVAEQEDTTIFLEEVSDDEAFFLGFFDEVAAAENLSILESEDDDSVTLVGQLLNYPNPFQIGSDSAGTTIAYRLSKDAAIELRLYTAKGKLLYKDSYEEGANGGSGSTKNEIPITASTFGGYRPPAGVYFLILIANDSILAKQRMVIIP